MKEKNKVKFEEFNRTIRIITNNPLGIIGVSIILLILVSALLAPVFSTHDPLELDTNRRLSPPSREHFFGTDSSGRDIFSRVIYGTRYSLLAACIVVGIAVAVGTIVGLVAGYPGGKRGEYLMRLTDIFLAFPTLVLAIAFEATFGPSFLNSLIAISLVYWPKYARLVYSHSLSIKETDYVKMAEILNESPRKIRIRHIFPNTVSTLLVQVTLDLGDAILYYAALSFLGLGAQPPDPDWGAMISTAQDFMMISWWMALYPGLAIFFCVIGFNLLGDSLRDALDPRLRRTFILKRGLLGRLFNRTEL